MGVPEYKAKAFAKVYTRYHIAPNTGVPLLRASNTTCSTRYNKPNDAHGPPSTKPTLATATTSTYSSASPRTDRQRHRPTHQTTHRIRPMDATRKPSQTLLLGQTSQTMVGGILLHDSRETNEQTI